MRDFIYNKSKSIFVFCIIILGSSVSLKAQNTSDDSIVFSIDDEPVYKTEFLRQYDKNNQSNFQNDTLSIADYADLYLNFKLKVQAAKDKGLDTIPEFKREFESYRKQLADKYISNGEVTENMVKETYHRMTNEVNASHILISLRPDATPADTLKAYNTAIDILKKINANESFEDLAVKYSKDPSVRDNKGNMGWFKAYKMVYPFETAAYELNIDEVSEPVRTQFGYHIIKKNDERPSRGKIKVAHIMKNLQSQDSTYSSKDEIQKIYQKLKSGEDFSDLAKQFSDHKSSASKGGELSAFSVGQLNSSKFEEVAFRLDKKDSISKPFKTQFGWHIVKYLDEIPVEPLENLKPEIIKKIKTSNRSKRLIDNIKKDLMTKYEVLTNYELLSTLENRINDSILKFKWNYKPQKNDEVDWVLKIDDHQFMLNEFLNYIEKQQRILKPNDIQSKINMAIDKFTYAKLINIHNQNLEKISPEFANEIKTYHEGLLLFDVMEKTIWKPTQNDSLALQKYYNNHSDDFKSKTAIDGIIASSSSKKVIKKIKKEVDEAPLETLKEAYPEVIFKTLEQVEIDDSGLPEDLKLEAETSKMYKHNAQFLCIYIKEIYTPKLLEFSQVKGKIISKLQSQREEEWITQLKSKYDVYINKNLIRKIQ